MVDKIKAILERVELTEQGFSKFKHFGRSTKDNNILVYKRYLGAEDNKDLEIQNEIQDLNLMKDNKKKYRITLTLIYNKRFNISKLLIEGNLRKWYFGINNISDLQQKDFCMVIKLLAKEIGIEENKLWNAKITKLETGVTIKLKEEHRAIFNCIFGYKGFRKNTYDNTGVEFKGENYDLIFYDMLRRIYNKKNRLERSYKKLAKNNFLVRYEIQGHKVSGMDMFKDKANTLLRIKNNWKYLGQNILDTLDRVEFVNTISPAIFIDVKGGTKKQMSNYLIYKGIKSIGIENMRQLVDQMNLKKRSEYRKDFIKLYEEHLVKDRLNYDVIFRQKVEKRVHTLCKKLRVI